MQESCGPRIAEKNIPASCGTGRPKRRSKKTVEPLATDPRPKYRGGNTGTSMRRLPRSIDRTLAVKLAATESNQEYSQAILAGKLTDLRFRLFFSAAQFRESVRQMLPQLAM
jgi:hypothetical protein